MEVRIGALQVFHVVEPLSYQQAIHPFNVPSEVREIRLRTGGEVFPFEKLLGEVEGRPQEIGEGLVFEEHRVFEEADHEVLIPTQKLPQMHKIQCTDIHSIGICPKSPPDLLELVC